jgi:hypothetical protein
MFINGKLFMEEWNVGILEVRAQINHLNCKKLLQTHHSITPSFHYFNWGEALSSIKLEYTAVNMHCQPSRIYLAL